MKMKVLTDFKFNSFERNLIYTLNYASAEGQGYLSCIGHQ